MSAADDIYEQLRELRKITATLRKRINGLIVWGVVKQAPGKKVKLQLIEQGVDGEVATTWLRLGQPGGASGGGHSQYVKPGVGEPMLIISPGGEINEHSRVFPAGHFDDFDSPGTAESDGLVHVAGDAKLELKNGAVTFTVGGVSVAISGAGVAVTGGTITHDGHAIDKTHKHTDVVPGGGLSGPPQ